VGGDADAGLGDAPGGGDLTDRETLRKLLHLAAGLPAFALGLLSWPAALALTVGLLLFNLLVWPYLGGRSVWRPRERGRGAAPGVVAYPAVLVVAVLLFPRQLELVAATWALLAFGDGAAALVGSRLPLARLPWNRDKSWGGSIGCWLVGWAASAAALQWTAPTRLDPWTVLSATCLGGLVAAAVESLPGTLDDNWTAPLLGAGVIAFLLAAPAPTTAPTVRLLTWLGASALLATLAALRDRLSGDGAIAAAIVGTGVGAGLGWPGWALLALFFVAGVVASGTPETAGGGRGRRGDQVLANGGVGALTALLWIATGLPGFRLACLAAVTEAAVDTVSGEIGQRLGARARLLTTWREVPPGTDGAVSWAGSGIGLAVAGLFVAVARLGGLISWGEAVVVAAAAVLGAGLDSWLGATLERSGRLDNQGVNLVSTASAALIAGCWKTL
jgi:uncharacterized protein (TIGR00297 family)